MTQLNNIELNAILYYADFLSLQKKSIPVTDTCKYFFVYNTPINSAFIAGVKPVYDENNQYVQQSKEEYLTLKSKFGLDGVLSFINNISNLGAVGCVDGIRMLKCIHQYSQKDERREAFIKYRQYMKNTWYSHIIKTDDGKSKRVECSKYIAHYEEVNKIGTEPEIHNGTLEDKENTI